MLTGFGRAGTTKPRSLLELIERAPRPPGHPLPSDLGVGLPAGHRVPDALDTIVARGLAEGGEAPGCYLESLRALSRALGGQAELARAVEASAARASLAPPVEPLWDGSRRALLLPCF